MLKRLLIANRGEIARRVIRTARRMGVETVAVYSDADANAPHVREADFSVRIGPPPAAESYLDMAKVLAAAKETGADSVHPGYGFLSENADFAQAVEDAGLIWVGPTPSAIRSMGPKDEAKRIMEAAGVPVTPGWRGEDQSAANLAEQAAIVGFPVLIKAVAGGGGKGMRRVDRAEDFADALASAQREGQASFGNPHVLIERYMARPRHIEVQVFGDSHGNVVHLFERDCSLQRRHQKVIEEAPAPGMDEETRAAVCGAAVRAAQAVGYRGAGTVEFIADASEGLRADRIFFMEMNTRLQVEHPVTEMITGLDLVEWQLRVASGEPLPLRQDQIKMSGWAMEARLYAENPATGFLPSVGRLEHFRLPDNGVRVDSAVEAGGDVSPFYDPMIAKLIVHADTRIGAAEWLSDACGDVEVWPVKTNAAFLSRLAADPDFQRGDVDTGFIGARPQLTERATLSSKSLDDYATDLREHIVNFQRSSDGYVDDIKLTGFRLNAKPAMSAILYVDGERRAACLERFTANDYPRETPPWLFFVRGEVYEIDLAPPVGALLGAASDGKLLAPMPGRIVAVAAKAGDRVAKGAPVITLEAMKMEHALTAPFDAVVSEVAFAVGDQVTEGAVLATLEKTAG
ncbi:acetyl/propionyl/methylcrotonyl-CoA carboxylase subunit alpha [soil metagenome]